MSYDKKTLKEVLARLDYLEDVCVNKDKEGFSDCLFNVRWEIIDMLGELENWRRGRCFR